jgi:DNA-binding LacI/PurR family transcriptional regulator
MAAGLPQRISLLDATITTIGARIRAGDWRDFLPGERVLSEQLQVSRGTLRSALAALASGGVIRIEHGKPCRIVGKIAVSAARARSVSVGLLSPVPLSRLRPFTTLWIDQLRERLAATNGSLTIYHQPKCYQRRPSAALQRLTRQNPHTIWLLLLSTEAMQRWFKASGCPAIVAGSVYADCDMAWLDHDQRAMGRHCAGAMLARGYRRLAVLHPDELTAGVMDCVAGFREGVDGTRHPDASVAVGSHGPGPGDVCRAIDRLFTVSAPPRAMLVIRADALLTAWTHLARRGIAIPRDLAVVCIEDEGYLSRLVPAVAGYAWDSRAYADQLARLLMKVAVGSASQGITRNLMPRFEPRQTLPRQAPGGAAGSGT